MWFTFVTARLFIFLSFQPRLAATLLRSCSVVNSPTRRVGLAPTFRPASLAQAPLPPVRNSAPASRLLAMRLSAAIREAPGFLINFSVISVFLLLKISLSCLPSLLPSL